MDSPRSEASTNSTASRLTPRSQPLSPPSRRWLLGLPEEDAAGSASTPLLSSTSASQILTPRDREPQLGSHAIVVRPDWVVESVNGDGDEGTSAIPAQVFNITNTVIGAGMMALPWAFKSLGIFLGGLLLLAVYGLSYVSTAALVRASEETSCWTYIDVVQRKFGKAGKLILEAAIIANNAGIMVVMLIMMGDILLGGVESPTGGLFRSLFNLEITSAWYFSRSFVVGLVTSFVLLPLMCLRHLNALAATSGLSVVLSSAFVFSVVCLAIKAICLGRVVDIHWWPHEIELGQTWTERLINVFGIAPLMLTAYVCHYNIHPAMAELPDYKPSSMRKVLKISLAMATVLYLSVGIGGYVIFGEQLQGDILANFSVQSIAPLVGTTAAKVVVNLLLLSFWINLIATFPLLNWALREAIIEVCFAKKVKAKGWYSLTVLTAFIIFCLAMSVPDIQTPMRLLGGTATVVVGFIFPALLVFWTGQHIPRQYKGLLAGCMIGLGAVLAVSAVASTLLQQ